MYIYIYIFQFLFRTVSPKITKFNSFYSQPIDSSFMLTCNVYQGTQPLQFKWLKNGSPLDYSATTTSTNNLDESSSSSNLEIETKHYFSHLILHRISVHDSSNYSCVVSSPFGIDSQWSVLEVKGLWFKDLNMQYYSINLIFA